jgi:hypothetical protein
MARIRHPKDFIAGLIFVAFGIRGSPDLMEQLP